jgi:phosphoribosylformylglycinamidine synthase
MLSSIDGCARHEIFDQYDQRVGARTVRDASSPIGVIKLPSQRLLGVVLGCRPYMMRLDVELGSLDALIFSYLELSCLGFEPVAVTDCLNFGSPENPKVMGDFMQAVACLAKAAEAFATPVISGNVSLYNETLGKAVTPTPAIGMVGLREHAEDLPLSQWTQEHDTIYLVRAVQVWTFGLSSEFFDAPKEWTGQIELALLAEWAKKLQVLALSSELHCARVVGKFGLVYHLARMANADFDLGCRVNTSKLNFKQPAELFQERLYEVIVSGSPQLEAELQKLKVDFCYLGQVVKSEFVVDDLIVTTVKDISHAMDKGFRSHFAKL